MHTRVASGTAQRLFTVVAVFVLALVGVLAHPLSAAAATKLTLYSSEGSPGAKGVFTVTWKSATKVTIVYTLNDIKKDGRGPWLFLARDDCMGGNQPFYNDPRRRGRELLLRRDDHDGRL